MAQGRSILLAALFGSVASPPALPQGDGDARIYTTREERRDAGLKHELFDGFFVSGLVEFEALEHRTGPRVDSGHGQNGDVTVAGQLGIDFEPLDGLKAELTFETEKESEHSARSPFLDEGGIAAEVGDFELEVGRLYLPFGEYFSHFVTGPALEFGETRGRSAILSWGPSDALDVAVFAYRGRAREAATTGGHTDWGLAAETAVFDFGTVAVSYLSDLADSDARLLEDNNERWTRRVGGLNASLVAGLGPLELTAETVQALDTFRELDPAFDRPMAWNAELAWFWGTHVALALRLEGSRELVDAPARQAGLAIAWRVSPMASLQFEVLHGEYRRGTAEDDDGRELEHVHSIGGMLSIEL